MSKSERDAILQNAHHGTCGDGSGDHVSSEAMLAQIEPYYKWSNIGLDVEGWVCLTLLVS